MSTSIEDIISGCCEGKFVDVKGWVYRKRQSKETIFLVVRDATGIIQCTVKRKSPMWDVAEKVTIESSVLPVSYTHLTLPTNREV